MSYQHSESSSTTVTSGGGGIGGGIGVGFPRVGGQQFNINQVDFAQIERVTGISQTKLLQLHQDFLRAAGPNQLMDRNEFIRLFSQTQVAASPQELNNAFTTFDRDNSGNLSFNEFLEAVVTLNRNVPGRERLQYLVNQSQPAVGYGGGVYGGGVRQSSNYSSMQQSSGIVGSSSSAFNSGGGQFGSQFGSQGVGQYGGMQNAQYPPGTYGGSSAVGSSFGRAPSPISGRAPSPVYGGRPPSPVYGGGMGSSNMQAAHYDYIDESTATNLLNRMGQVYGANVNAPQLWSQMGGTPGGQIKREEFYSRVVTTPSLAPFM